MALIFISLNSWSDDTRRGKLKPKPKVTSADTITIASPFDTIVAPSAELVTLSGYDKPLRATAETMFVTNRLQAGIVSLSLNISYYDMEGHQLHQRDVEVRNSIPAGATRQIKIKSWDSQKSFYYHLGQRPRVDAVTPYKVNCAVNSCVVDNVKQ
ncbi:MAG: hypothetical protein NC221_03210 [Duncaniella sp.]|nr:hypothetical protein [Duncaniella sp.]